jgi:hypothetical protein
LPIERRREDQLADAAATLRRCVADQDELVRFAALHLQPVAIALAFAVGAAESLADDALLLVRARLRESLGAARDLVP